jgi:endoglucanase
MFFQRFAPFLLVGGLWQFFPCPCAAKILVDQVGYLPGETKIAVFVDEKKNSFRVLDHSTGREVYEGLLSAPQKDPDTGLTLRHADFSPVTLEGDYLLEGDSENQSRPFHIGPGVFRSASALAMRSYYGQRCGIAVDMGPDFPACTHKACHLEDGFFHPSSGRSGFQKATQGWHDAGDYGKYIVNSGITVGTLLMAWDFYGDRWRGVTLRIPESGGRLPDFLAEIKWNLDWMLCMQDSDGGVWHKLTSETFCPFIPPEDDHDKRYFIGTGTAPFKSSAATGDFAAVMATASRLYRPYNKTFSEHCLQSAEKAWSWLERHPDVPFSNPPGVRTGGYADKDCSDEQLWAAVELWRVTGNPAYHRIIRIQVMRRAPRLVDPTNPCSWSQVAPLAYWSYALSGRDDCDKEVLKLIRQSTLSAAQEVAARTAQSPWRHSLLRQNFIWGSNAVALNYSLLLRIADRMGPNQAFRDAAMDNLHYVLGRNAFDTCWVTRLGTHSTQHPHHRPSANLPVAPENASPGKAGETSKFGPWPGLLSGGPNFGRQDPALRRLSDDTPPGLCWVDERESYAGNEVAINWNAPLVFALSADLPKSVEAKSHTKAQPH